MPLPTVAKELRRFLGMANFYRRFIAHAAETQQKLHKLIDGNKKNDQTPINWSPDAVEAFEQCKKNIADATLLAHPVNDASLVLAVNASDFAVGAALHQIVNGQMQPLGFYSKGLTKAQRKYSTYDRELLAVFQGVKYFRYILEARPFVILTDHQPLTFAFDQKSDKASPRVARQLDFVGQFSTDIRHIKGTDNIIADLLSRIPQVPPSLDIFCIEAVSSTDSSDIDFAVIAHHQSIDPELERVLGMSSLNFKKLKLPNCSTQIYCDTPTGRIRPYIPEPCRRSVFNNFHNLSHAGASASLKLISERFVWPAMNRDVKQWARCCIPCQKSKISRHVKSALHRYPTVSERFQHINIDLVGPLPPSQGNIYCLTIIDRFTRWPDAIPLTDSSAVSVASSFIGFD